MRMGLGDLVGKAKDALEQHGDKVSDGLEKAGDFVKSKTPDKVAEPPAPYAAAVAQWEKVENFVESRLREE